jgi:cytochrome P450
MSILAATTPLRPSAGEIKAWIASLALSLAPAAMAAARRVWPIPGHGKFWMVTRYDDVREVFAADHAFMVPYHENLNVITGGAPFFLGMGDTPDYSAQIAAARAVVRDDDLPRLGHDAEHRASAIVATAGGEVEVVGLIRRVAFDLIGSYFGVPEPTAGRLDVWGSRLFEFQFTGSVSNAPWLAEVEIFAAALRAHIDATIAARKATPSPSDDVLSRCLTAQAAGKFGYSDLEIRTLLMCMIVGGPPQPPMVVPQALEQLLRRPDWLCAASDAARAGDDTRLHDIVFEAMRFDPLPPGLKRTALTDYTVAAGTPRARLIPAGSTVLPAFGSAMFDPRRIVDPQRFDPTRPPRDYLHFGHGLHECFGRMINHATLHRMLKPLLAQKNVRRSDGRNGHLSKDRGFAERLVVAFDPA